MLFFVTLNLKSVSLTLKNSHLLEARAPILDLQLAQIVKVTPFGGTRSQLHVTQRRTLDGKHTIRQR